MIEFKLTNSLTEAYNYINEDTKVSILVFASHKRYGGGYKNHSKAQEEYLFNNTNLANRYTEEIKSYYPFKYEDTKGFIVNSNNINFIFMPALVWESVPSNINKETILEERIKEIYRLAKSVDTDYLILGSWSCGVFKCPPKLIASLFKKCLPQHSAKHSSKHLPQPSSKHLPQHLYKTPNIIFCFLDEKIKSIFEDIFQEQ